MDTRFPPIEDVLTRIRDGTMVILVDDEDRENEGDLVLAAEKATPQYAQESASDKSDHGHTWP